MVFIQKRALSDYMRIFWSSGISRPKFEWAAMTRPVFNDIRQQVLEDSIVFSDESQRLAPPEKIVKLDSLALKREENILRHQLRAVDFVVEVRDARIPVSTSHPKLKSWAGKKPKVLVLNKADMISHVERAAWDKHFEEKSVNVVWTSATSPNSGVSFLIRRFFDANFEVNRRRRKTNLVLRHERAVLSLLTGYSNTGKKSLLKRLIGKNPKIYDGHIPDKGRPDLLDHSITWYMLEGSVLMMDQTGDIPMYPENDIAASRLVMCNNFTKSADFSKYRVALNFLNHLRTMRNIKPSLKKIEALYGEFLDTVDSEWFISRLAEKEYQGDLEAAGGRILEDFNSLKFGQMALEMPYMLEGRYSIEEPLVYDKDTATGLQNGICSQF